MLVTTEKSSDESYQLKEIVRSVGTELIREKMSQYIKELRQGIKIVCSLRSVSFTCTCCNMANSNIRVACW